MFVEIQCCQCNEPVSWMVHVGGYFGGALLLYHYAKLAGSAPRYQQPNVWGCDRCQTAGVIHHHVEEPNDVD